MIGFDHNLIKEFDIENALKKIGADVFSDFIFAPHYSAIFVNAPNELREKLFQKLKQSKYDPKLPITIEVVKKSGITRPGSILNPIDRLLYQCLIDKIAPIADKDIDRLKVFSNILSTDCNCGSMFVPFGECYNKFKTKLRELCEEKKYEYVLYVDMANYFERIYQHVLINLLRSSNIKPEYIKLLEKILSAFSQKDSHGIIQGVVPSDFLGNYYLCGLDEFLKTKDIEFVRFVDDYWMFFKSEKEARCFLVNVCNYIRKEGLALNESKTRIKTTKDIINEETKIDQLFNSARDKFSIKHVVTFVDYSFEPFESEIEVEENETELNAIKELYEKREENPSITEKIDKFSLRLLAKHKCDIAIDNVLKEIVQKPHMIVIYAQYLGTLAANGNKEIYTKVENLLLNNDFLYSWQKIWVYGLLYHAKKVSSKTVDVAYTTLLNFKEHETVRAICAILISKFGDGAKRRVIRNHYSIEQSSYVKEAILYSTKFFPSSDDRNACIKSRQTHSDVNELIAIAIKNEISV